MSKEHSARHKAKLDTNQFPFRYQLCLQRNAISNFLRRNPILIKLCRESVISVAIVKEIKRLPFQHSNILSDFVLKLL